MLHTPNTGQNINFQCFLGKKAEKKMKQKMFFQISEGIKIAFSENKTFDQCPGANSQNRFFAKFCITFFGFFVHFQLFE